MSIRRVTSLLSLALMACGSLAVGAQKPACSTGTIQTSSGPVCGMTSSVTITGPGTVTASAYLGIPYAVPPIGSCTGDPRTHTRAQPAGDRVRKPMPPKPCAHGFHRVQQPVHGWPFAGTRRERRLSVPQRLGAGRHDGELAAARDGVHPILAEPSTRAREAPPRTRQERPSGTCTTAPISQPRAR